MNKQLIWYISSILLVFFLTIVFYIVSNILGYNGIDIPLFGGGFDSLYYWDQSQLLLKNIIIKSDLFFPHLIAFFLKILNWNDPFVIRLIHVIIYGWLLIILNMLTIAGTTNMKRNTRYLYFFSLYPTLIAISTLGIIRDIWLCFLYFNGLYLVLCLFNVTKTKLPKFLIIVFLVIDLIILLKLRIYAFVIFILSSFVICFVFNKKNIPVLTIFAGILVGFAIYYTLLKDYNLPLLNMSLKSALEYRHSGTINYAGGSQMNINLNQTSIFLFFLNYFYSLVSNIIGPLPWQINSAASLIIFITESLTVVYLIRVVYRYRKQIFFIEKFLLIHFIVYSLSISLINDNLGTATRLRLVPLMILILVCSRISKKENINETLPIIDNYSSL